MEKKLKKSRMGKLRFTALLLMGLLLFSDESNAQTTYSTEGFNNSMSLFSVTNGTAAYRTGNSGTGDRPASSPYAFEGTHGFSCVNTNITLQSLVIDTRGICGASLTFDLAAFSLGSTTNGLDGADEVRVDISPDNGANYYRTIDIDGNNNAFWSYSATGVASTAYDGNANTVTFAPAGGGSRTTDGYSTVQISNLPNVSQLIIRIYLTTSANSEGWVIDDFKIQGNPPSAMSTTPATRCTPGTLTLGATASGCGLTPTIAWFANASGGSALQSATTNPSSYTTPSLSSTTSYYVEQQYAAGVGIGTNTGNITTTGVGLAFTAHTSFTLNSVAMRIRKNSAADGAMTVLIKDNAGTVINTITLVIPGAANNNNNNTYNIGHTFIPGNYTMEVSSMSANITRVYFTSGMAYPLHYGALSFTGNVGNAANTYNYFYDWNISLPRQEVIATIGTNVNPSVSVSSSDADNSICSGTSVTFTASPTNGGSAPAYQWKLNGNNVGTNSATYTNGALANNDVVTVVMTANNACQTSATANGNSITTTVNTTVSPSVSIVSNDADNFICEGTMIVFTATPTNGGTSPVYQWKINGMDMGGNTSTFDTNVLINGDVVSVQMTTNHLCQTQATSNSNSLTISVGLNTAPSVAISSSDADNIVCQGSSVTYTAIPTNGGSAPSYQWVLNGNNVGTNSTTFSNAINSNQTVSVIMTSNYECQTSSSATANALDVTAVSNVNPSVTISSSDNDNAICAGESVTFTATPTNGGPSPSYQWKLNGANVGSNSTTYTNTTLPNNGIVTVVMTANNTCQTSANANGNNISTGVTNNVTPSVSVSSTFVANAGNATWGFGTANSTAVANVTISALSQNNNFGTNAILSGTSNSGGSYTGASGGNNAQATTINGGLNTNTSTYFQFTVTPSAAYSFTLNNLSMGMRSTGTGPTGYVLRSSLDNYASNIFVGSITNNSTWTLKTHALSTGNVSAIGQPVTYRIYGYGGTGATINNANWRIDDLVLSFVNSQSVCEGTNVTFTANPTNGGTTPIYQWTLNGSNVGSNATTYSNNNLVNGDVVAVSMTANNACQTASVVFSGNTSALLLENEAASVSISSSNLNNIFCIGSSASFTATPTFGGNNPTYQWRINGANVGTNSNVYSNATMNDNDVVTVVMTSNRGCVTPAVATSDAISVDIETSLLTTTGAANCGGGNLMVSAVSSCSFPGSSISWFTNATGGTALASGSSYTANYNASTIVYAQENFIGGETVYGNDNTGTANRGLQFTLFTDITLNSVNIESDGTANITIQLWNAATNAPMVVNGNTYSATVPVVNGNNVETLGWFIPAGVGYRLVVTNMGGRNLSRTPNFTFPESLPGVGSITGNVDTGGADRYNFFYNWNYSTTRVPASVNITNPLVPSVSIASSDADNSICDGTSVTFTATPTNGGSTPVYQWKLNGTNVGTDATTYTNASLSNNDVVTVVMTANNVCQTSSTANSNSISTAVLVNNNYYADVDGDTYGPAASLVVTCIMPAGYTTESGDCDDANAEAYPFNLEICNGIDDDCDGTNDNGISTYTFYADQDGDGYGSNTSTIVACDYVVGYLMTNGDCNDALATVNPQASELCSTSYDDDCDGLINEVCNIVNDDPLFSTLIIPSTSLVNCNTVTGNLGGASPSAQVGVETLTGSAPDTWYYFTASSPGVTIRCIPTNDVRLELRSGAGLLLKSTNAVSGIGDEYLNFGELTVGGQYYVRVMQMDSPTLGGSFTLCTRRVSSSGNLNYTNSILYDSGCDIVYASNITGSTSCSIQLTPISPAGGPVLTGNGASIPLSNFTGANGEKFQYNTTYQATITLGFVLPLGNGGTEVVSVPRVSTNNLVVQQHLELDLGSVHACPSRVTIGGTVRANIWLCDAVRYQWKFEKTVNGILQLVNGNPVVIEVYGPLGTRDFVPSALMGFTAGSEWRVQVRPIFANNVVGDYGTNYQCMKFKGTAASMPTVEEEDDLFKDLNQDEALSLVLFPNPSGRSSVNVIWNAQESEDVQIIVRDMQGRMVQNIEHIQGNQTLINGSELSSGLYWVEWHSGAHTQRLRWMIQ